MKKLNKSLRPFSISVIAILVRYIAEFQKEMSDELSLGISN